MYNLFNVDLIFLYIHIKLTIVNSSNIYLSTKIKYLIINKGTKIVKYTIKKKEVQFLA